MLCYYFHQTEEVRLSRANYKCLISFINNIKEKVTEFTMSSAVQNEEISNIRY